MKVVFKASFAKDLRKIKDKQLKSQVGELITLIEQSNSLLEVGHIKKIVGVDNCYRIRLGDYRIGLIFECETVLFVRFLHRKDIYRYFP